MPSGGADSSPPAAWTVPSGPGAGPVAVIAGSAGAGAGDGIGGMGSASAAGAPKVNAATIPSAPETKVSAAVSLSILTDAPFPILCSAGAIGCFYVAAKIVTSGVDVTKQFIDFSF